jgi:hypothetical protein
MCLGTDRAIIILPCLFICGSCNDIYLTAIGLTPGGSRTVHIWTQTTQNTENGPYITINKLGKYITIKKFKIILGSAGCAPSLRVIPWHLPYKWGKSTEKPQLG